MAGRNMRRFVPLMKYFDSPVGFVRNNKFSSYSGFMSVLLTKPISNENVKLSSIHGRPLMPVSVNQNQAKTLNVKAFEYDYPTHENFSFFHGESHYYGHKKLGIAMLLTGGVFICGNLFLTWASPVEAAERIDAPANTNSAETSRSMFLYWASGSPPCWRVMLTLEEKGFHGYPNKLLTMSKKENKEAEVIKLNPRGQVPTFKHGSHVISESLAIVDYLETTFPNSGTKLIPDDPSKKALVLQRKYEALNLFSKGIEGHFFYKFKKAEDKIKGEEEARLKAFRDELDVWENILKQIGPGSYVAGRDFSVADVVLFPTLALMWRLGLRLERYPHLKEYFERVKKRKTVQDTWPPHWKDGPNQNYLADV